MAIATPWRTATGTSRSHHNVAPSTLHLAPSRLAQPAGLGSICEPRSREHLRASASICEPLRASGNICEPRSREFCALFGARKRARSLVSCMSQATRGVTDVMMCVDRCVSVSGRLMVDWACGVYTAPVCLTCLSVLHNHACIRLRMGVCWCACCVDGVCAAESCATVSIASTALGLALESTGTGRFVRS